MSFVLVLVLASSALVVGSVLAADLGPSQEGSLAREKALGQLEAIALAKGAVGVYRDAATGQVVVVVPASGSSTFRADDAAATGLDLRVEYRNIDTETVGRLTKELADLRSSIPLEWGYAFYFDPQLGKVVIQSEAPESEFAALESRFPDQVSFRNATLNRTSRSNDIAPHWGGASVTDGVNVCTTGFTMKNASGWRVMVTAGHCFPNGASTYQAGGSMGTVALDPSFPNPEVEILYGSTYAARIYNSNTTSIPVVGAADPVVGGTGYCYSGITTSNRCGFTNSNNNAVFCPSLTTCSFGMALFKGGSTVPQHGDSGAPYYLPSGSGASIRGMVVGNGCDPFGCQGYATRYNTIANFYVMSIATN